MNPSSNSWRDLKVGTKLTLIPAFFLVALGTILYFTISTLQSQQGKFVVLELVGRQRMLQQYHFSTALLVMDQRTTQEKLDYVRKVWLDTQRALIDGGPAIERMNRPEVVVVPAAPEGTVRDNLLKQSQLIQVSLDDTDRLITLTRTSPEFAPLLTSLLKRETEIQDLGILINKGYTAQLEQESKDLVAKEIFISVLVGALGFLISFGIARGVTQPLQKLVNLADDVSKGNLRTEKVRLADRSELGQLGNAFDNMLDNLKDLSGQILGVTGNINSAAAEILASTQQQASSTKEQAATVQEVSATMQEITQSGAEIAEKAKQIAASAEATSAASQSGVGAVQATTRLMEGIRSQIEEVAVKIVGLSERTQAIGEIVNTVNEISDQSNLLALNASIEAASAGEHGSRFAVVAGEMRNLAQRAKESTVQVGAILGEIQRGINSTVMLTEEAVKRSDSGRQQAQVTEQTINQMTQTTVESVHAFQQIIGATSQQQIGFDQVTQGMRDIRQAAEQTAIGTSQLEKALGNLNDLSIQLRAAVGRYQL
ncbi:MAG: methyl-accepting chemotaxis protein [Verrucomicrobium sp.]|nr:methyl-accepting chemotaxis protein [Verrucomicrobium sp.]